jgi:hypothetical protein
MSQIKAKPVYLSTFLQCLQLIGLGNQIDCAIVDMYCIDQGVNKGRRFFSGLLLSFIEINAFLPVNAKIGWLYNFIGLF